MKKLAIALVIGVSLLLIQSAAFAQKSETPASGPTVIEQDIRVAAVRHTLYEKANHCGKHEADRCPSRNFGRSTMHMLRRPRS